MCDSMYNNTALVCVTVLQFVQFPCICTYDGMCSSNAVICLTACTVTLHLMCDSMCNNTEFVCLTASTITLHLHV